VITDPVSTPAISARGAQPGTPERRQIAQAERRQNAVLLAQRNHVRHRAQRHQVQRLARIKAVGRRVTLAAQAGCAKAAAR